MHFETETAQRHSASSMNKSVENLLISSHEVISSINSSGLNNQGSATNLGSAASAENIQETPANSGADRNSPVSSPNLSPRPSPKAYSRREYCRLNSDSGKESLRANKSDDQLSQDVISRSSDSADLNKSSSHEKKEARSGERGKKKSSWYNVLYPTYKSRSEDFKRIFKDVPDDERLVVGLLLGYGWNLTNQKKEYQSQV